MEPPHPPARRRLDEQDVHGHGPELSRRGAAQRSTCWSVIVRAQGTGPEAQRALDELIRRYDRTVLTMIAALRPPWTDSAEDLKQEFFTGFIRRRDVEKLDRERGKFRTWLHAAVRNFMRNVWTSWHAQRRGHAATAPLVFEAAHDRTPELAFMRQFAEDTLLQALLRHRAEAADKAQFDRLVRFLPGPDLDLDELGQIAALYGVSRKALAVQIFRVRDQHKRVLRAMVADTLDVDPSDPAGAQAVELEMRQLFHLLVDAPRLRVTVEDA